MIPDLILASSSPRRRELLALGGQSFQVISADVDETPMAGEEPRDYVLRLAAEKARAAADSSDNINALIIAADTTVVDEGNIIGKPVDQADATRVLKSMRGRTHEVYSGIAIYRKSDGMVMTDLAFTEVPMRNYSDAEIDAYVASGEPLDKAGAYGIQHAGFHPVAKMEGCFANVIGQPLCHLKRSLQKMGVSFDQDLSAACQAHLSYDCPVTEKILAFEL
jgi:MAF protein